MKKLYTCYKNYHRHLAGNPFSRGHHDKHLEHEQRRIERVAGHDRVVQA